MKGTTIFLALILFMWNFNLLIQEHSEGLNNNPHLNNTTDSEWQITWGNNEYDFVSGIVIDSSENIIISGSISGYANTSDNMVIVKFNSTGQYQWNKTWGFVGVKGVGQAIAIDSSDNIFIVGLAEPGYGLRLVKFNSFGDYQWNTTYSNYRGGLEISTLSLDQYGNIYVVGTNGSILADIFISKFNHLGIEQWRYIYDEPASSFSAADLVLDSSNNIYVVGNNLSDIILVKLSNLGNFQWALTLDGILEENFDQKQAYAMVLDSSDNIYISGHGQFDFLLIKLDSSGTIQWFRTQHLGIYNMGYDVALDSMDNIYIVGDTGPGNDLDMGVVRYDVYGNYSGYGILSENSYDRIRSVAIDSYNNVYFAGTSSMDIVLIKNLQISLPPTDTSTTSNIPSYNIFIIIGLISITSALIIYKQGKKNIK